MRVLCRQVAVTLILITTGLAQAEESRTSLIIEGGRLPPNCPALKRLVAAATMNGRIRIGYVATASSNPTASAKLFRARMSNYGVAPEQVATGPRLFPGRIALSLSPSRARERSVPA